MRRFYLSLSTLAAAALVAGCSGITSAPNAPNTSSIPAVHSSSGGYVVSRLMHWRHTPPGPPPRRHRITGADRARALAGGWTPVTQKAPWSNGADTEVLMTDGTVMVHDYCTSNWYALAPDKTGNYINGTWTKMASLPSSYGPLYHASAVLADGKLIINGGEYNFCNTAETTLGAIYDPVANTWTSVTPPSGWSQIGDASSVVLSNGTYMLGNCCGSNQALLNESSMTWTVVSTGKADTNSEEGWTLLRSGKVLTLDVFNAPNTELFNPSSNMWSSAGSTPNGLVSGLEIGPQTLRPNDTVFVAGATGATAIYNEKGGTWSAGPSFPKVGTQQVDAADAPSALLINGTVMVAASPGLYQSPTSFFLFDGKALHQIAAPPNAPNDSSYNIRLLTLPSGQTLQTDDSADVEIYSAPRRAWPGIAPAITSVPTTLAHGSTYKIKGLKFNGISQANMYGDDVQEATNYPLVRIVNNSTGHVFYARTHGHSFMGVGSSGKVSTMFDVPSGIETGASTLYVVVNGIKSAGVSVTIT
jgi:hypothetical protein